MSLKNLIDKRIVACEPNTPVTEVASLMEQEDVGAVLVLQQGKPRGIITDRDIAVRCVANQQDCENTRAEDIMTETVETVSEDAGLFNVIECMRKKQIRRVPVVNEKGIAVGLLSFGDIVNLLGREIGTLTEPLTPKKGEKTAKAA